jgi:hypothetical protein
MLCDGYDDIWDLEPGELVRLENARGTTLRVTRGTVWITLQNDTRDIVLDAGDVFTIDRGGLTLAESQGASTVCVMARGLQATHVRPGARAWAREVPAWLRTLNAARRWVPYF